MMNPFDKKIPSLIVVSTPLQVLCAIEAIKEFEIFEYTIIVPYFANEIRMGQTFSMLEFYQLDYTKYNINDVGNAKMLADMLLPPNKHKYQRAFIGHYVDIRGKMVALPYMQKGGNFVFLDDGASSITILKGLLSLSLKNRILDRCFNMFSKLKGVNVTDYFFTFYSDIKTTKSTFPNLFSSLRASISKLKREGVYFVGTNPQLYCSAYGLKKEDYKPLLYKVLKQIIVEFPGLKHYYVPHGRDIGSESKAVCDELGIIFQKLDEAVELYLIKQHISPIAFVGFTSSALYNIHKFMPDVNVINYEVISENDGFKKQHEELNSYYQKNGIERRQIHIRD